MGGRGPAPKDPARRRRRNLPVYEWLDVEDVPYSGPIPVELPEDFCEATRHWWAVCSTMPHCVLWAESDWHFALDTARIAEVFNRNPAKVQRELRQRERVLGFTFDARRYLRIRYVEREAPVPDGVRSITDYRALAARRHWVPES